MKKKVLEYNATFEKEADGGYAVWVPSLPGCASQGDTLQEAITNIQEAIALYLEDTDTTKIKHTKSSSKRLHIPVQVLTKGHGQYSTN